MAAIDDLFKILVDRGGSDLHLSSGAAPYIRLHGSMQTLEFKQLSSQEVQSLIFEILQFYPLHV